MRWEARPPAGTANGGGTILVRRNNHWYTTASNGKHLHLLRSGTPAMRSSCFDFGCAAISSGGSRIKVPSGALGTLARTRTDSSITVTGDET